MISSNFKTALDAGDVGEKMSMQIMQAIGYEVEDVSNNPEYFSKDIDFLAIGDKGQMEIEVKSDSKMCRTGNVVLEMVSNVRERKKGWFFYTQATHVFFVDVPGGIIHSVRLNELKQLYKKYECRLKCITNGSWECDDTVYKESELVLLPVGLLSETPHYVRLDCKEIINNE